MTKAINDCDIANMRTVLFMFIFLLCHGCGPRIHVTPPDDTLRWEQTLAWTQRVRDLGASGDWLVIRGYKKADDLVVAATNIPLSHSAILDKENDQVVEAVGTGVRITPLRTFVHHAHRVILIRPRWWDPELGEQAVKQAQMLVGKKYDFLGTIGFGSDKKFYCSELCMHVYQTEQTRKDRLPRVIEPGQMYLWGSVSFDSQTRN